MYKYRNSNVNYSKELFKGIDKANGKLIAISNGGYSTYSLKFAFRIYFDKKNNCFNCQVISEASNKLGKNKFNSYSVPIEKEVNAETIQNAILYNEYANRVKLNIG